MRYALIVPDGAADLPSGALGGRTPLEAAHVPHLARLAREGAVGLAVNVPADMAPGSDVACLSLMGYDPHCLTGRAALEAAARGVAVPEGGAVFRANLVTVEDGIMVDHSAGHIGSEEARELIAFLQDNLRIDGVTLYPGVGYRHLCVVEDMAFQIPVCTPPHDILGRGVADYDPIGGFSSWVLEIERTSQELLQGDPVNLRRRAAGLSPATELWLWGGATPMTLPSFESLFGVTGTLISAVDLMRGIGALAGLAIPEIPGATGFYDTNYEGKGRAAVEALRAAPFVCVHVEATDEAGHNGDAAEKVAALEAIDRHIVAPLLEEAERSGDLRLLVCPDHPTPLDRRTHTPDPVPFVFWGPGFAPNGAEAFTEAEAQRLSGGQTLVGVGLMPTLLR